jgi:hypothetical protein
MKKRKGRKPPKCTQLKFYEVLTVPMLNSYCENCTLDRSSVKTKILAAQVKILTSEAGFTLIETEIQKCGTNLVFTVSTRKQKKPKNFWGEHMLRGGCQSHLCNIGFVRFNFK